MTVFMNGTEIYFNFVNGRGGGSLAAAAETVKQLVAEYEQQADEIIELTKAMESAWQGDAAGVAQRGAGPLVIAHALAAPQIDVAQDLSARQVGSFGDAKNSVVAVPDKPIAPDPWPILSPQPMATYAEQVAAYNTAVQHNVDVMNGYSHSSMYNTVGLPSSYGSLADDSADVAIDTPDDGPVGPRPPRVPDSGPGVNDPGARVLDQPRPSEPTPGPSEPGRPGPVDVPSRQVTDPGGFQPPTTGVPGGQVPPIGGPGGGGPADRPNSGLGVGAIGPVVGPGPDARPGGRSGGGWSGAERVAGRGGGLASGGDADGGRASGGRGGVGGPGAVVPVEGTRGARGGPGGVPVGGVGAGKGRGADDEEHERASFLQDPDPEATFGTNERTAPSVIE